ncbi:amidohydrolase family protein [Lacticaseibacillus jixiensis]|uniref:amidohydrolase family protein n=1 Tax=Lacticaseibacillus jixiensis TaxID=3231926 RepID=UPI0036F43BE6
MSTIHDYLASVPLVDHHCHYLIKASAPNRAKRLAQVSTEADNAYPLSDTKNRLAWHAFIDEANRRAIDPQAPLRDLTDAEYATYNQRVFGHYRFTDLFIDTGFVPDDPILDLAETAKLTGTRVHAIYRIETHAETWLDQTDNFNDWFDGLAGQVAAAKANGYVGFKSIAAYRFGLRLTNPTQAEAVAAYNQWRASGINRLTSPTLISYILWQLAPTLAAQHMPLQFHVGYGDADTDLFEGNPLLLRPFLQEFCPQGLPVVLLHCYPYHKEAGYLASVFPNLYFDISLIDNLGPHSVPRVLDEALDLAPYSRFLFASDASTYAEMYAVGARTFKQALAQHLDSLDYISEAQKQTWCDMICHGNAERLYLHKA